MARLENVTADDLRAALDDVERKTPALRLVAAIAYKHGVTQTELASWLDVERKTVYNWFDRIEDATDVADAVRDEPRPGRPRKLSPEAQAELADDLAQPPTERGYDADSWTPRLLQAHVESAYGAQYSLPSCRRLLRELRE